ncbi:hypothetical protein P6U16_25875 (plasmid) [Rhizobium sp. 32-5/1]|uniref:hypothetical protein n=1 Tax=Rhizobium sp. 32-5/1 TaxID=3019602 RepID=UPI00240E21E7|nr:hypothetical protein [Rhizobium sp. 32-5/1]WEZ85499.1 hypothetical protein P6U16_25875 [Rhizobium sp. 32-5/1]
MLSRLFERRYAKWLSWALLPILLFSAFAIAFPDILASLDARPRLKLILDAIGGVLCDPVGNDLTVVGPDREGRELALLVRHGTASALVATAAVATFLTLYLQLRRGCNEDAFDGVPLPLPPTVIGDGSVFRTGSLGGLPPRFLEPHLAAEIVELISYRPTGRSQDIDLSATIERRARGDRDALVFGQRKELPTIVVLADDFAEARSWNTLAVEFRTALEERGLSVEWVAYSGSFSRSDRGTGVAGAVLATVESIAQRSAWIVTTVFGDLRRLSRGDLAALAEWREHGPVIAFDYHESGLWDSRHGLIENKGIPVHPATGPALRQALAVAFAPDRAAIRNIAQPPAGAAVFHHLSEAHAQWASACAMVEPISFALAEKLRKAHPKLAHAGEALAFSLLARLPESWTGREGLRFAPDIRRALLSRATAISREQHFAFLAVMDKAFGTEPDDITAGELWRYTRAQAELFTPRQDRALQDIGHIRQSGIVDRDAINDFTGSLRPSGGSRQPGTVHLTGRMSKPFALKDLLRQDAAEEAEDAVRARWSVGPAEIRVRIGSDAGALAAFLPGGASFLMVTPGREPFALIDAVSGGRFALRVTDDLERLGLAGRDFTAIHTFQTTPIESSVLGQTMSGGVLAARSGRLVGFALPLPFAPEQAQELRLNEIALEIELGADPLLALSPVADFVACATRGASRVTVTPAVGEGRSQTFELPQAVTALVFSRGGSVLCGLENGDVFECSVLEGSARPRRIAEFGAAIAVLADSAGPDSRAAAVIAALADGRIVPAGSAPSDFDGALPWRPKWITVFPDLKAGLDGGSPAGFSVAATSPNGEFDVVGLMPPKGGLQFEQSLLTLSSIDPVRDGLAVVAINAERRRLVVRSGLYLEIRSLLYELADATEPESRADDQSPTPLGTLETATTEVAT